MPLDPVPTERQFGKGETFCLGNELTKCYFFPNNAPRLADSAYSSDFKQKSQIEAAVLVVMAQKCDRRRAPSATRAPRSVKKSRTTVTKDEAKAKG